MSPGDSLGCVPLIQSGVALRLPPHSIRINHDCDRFYLRARSRIAMTALLTPALLRRLEQFQLLAARRAKSSAKGERRSRARGQSVEFADYRNYSHGDDFRYLDWNLYGRLERLFVKLYEEE